MGSVRHPSLLVNCQACRAACALHSLVFSDQHHICRLARTAQAELYATALQETHDGYEAGPEATDFQAQLAARVQQLAAQQR